MNNRFSQIIYPQVNYNSELIQTVIYLADVKDKTRQNIGNRFYCEEIDRRFENYRDHAAVSATRNLIRNMNFNYTRPHIAAVRFNELLCGNDELTEWAKQIREAATFAPTPFTDNRSVKSVRSSLVRKPYSSIASSRTSDHVRWMTGRSMLRIIFAPFLIFALSFVLWTETTVSSLTVSLTSCAARLITTETRRFRFRQALWQRVSLMNTLIALWTPLLKQINP